MNILYPTISQFADVEQQGIYTDLLRKFRDEGHNIYIVKSLERRFDGQTGLIERNGVYILNVKTLNIQKTNKIEKGLGTLLIDYQFLYAAKKYYKDISFDLILYATPPVTFTRLIKFIKAKGSVRSYLLLKDIFPQNAVDLDILRKGSLLYNYFRKKEKKLYRISDHIGCMSPANKRYVLKHNADLDEQKVEVNPNSIDLKADTDKRPAPDEILRKYGIPCDRIVFIYGGNLGKPQGVEFLLDVLEANRENQSVYFVIVGSGTEYPKVSEWFGSRNPANAKLLHHLPRTEYDNLERACDIGMLFLDKRFTIPNFPSRLLGYLKHKLPIVAATDKNTDIGKIAEDNGFGFWSESGDLKSFKLNIQKFLENEEMIRTMGKRGFDYLKTHYTVTQSYKTIMKHFEKQ